MKKVLITEYNDLSLVLNSGSFSTGMSNDTEVLSGAEPTTTTTTTTTTAAPTTTTTTTTTAAPTTTTAAPTTTAGPTTAAPTTTAGPTTAAPFSPNAPGFPPTAENVRTVITADSGTGARIPSGDYHTPWWLK